MARKSDRLEFSRRAAGLLLHPTSLPGPHGVGDLGAAAYAFVDFLAAAGLTWWQMLPVAPTGHGDSPYSALSAFAGNPLLISLERLVEEGWLRRRDVLPPARAFVAERAEYERAALHKDALLRRAFAEFGQDGGARAAHYRRFVTGQQHWLDAHARFMARRRAFGKRTWLRWPAESGRGGRRAGGSAAELEREADYERFLQFLFDRQWTALRGYANARGIGLIGDIPIFVAHDSSDVWAHPELFDLHADGRARTVSGVPPDLFSRTGQLWGHPHYRWARHRATGFAWWLARFRRAFEQFDAVRIDHFLGFKRVWAVPGGAKTAQRGKWVTTPGEALFAKLRAELGPLPIIAEDLGLLTPQAAALRDRYGFPGMRLLHFAFGNDAGDRYHQPHAHPPNCVVYPGTHDNDTTVGWFRTLRREHEDLRRGRRRGPRRSEGRAERHARPNGASATPEITPYERVLRYTGTRGREVHWDLIRLAFFSPANTAIIPLQDVLGLDGRARMNIPATAEGNWRWRFRQAQLTPAHAERLRGLAEAYGRSGAPRTG